MGIFTLLGHASDIDTSLRPAAGPVRRLSYTCDLPWCFALQDKVINSISELYSFMDGADGTLALKVLGEVDEDGSLVGEGQDAAGVQCTLD